jgi:hypothetical protein
MPEDWLALGAAWPQWLDEVRRVVASAPAVVVEENQIQIVLTRSQAWWVLRGFSSQLAR